MGRKVFFYFVMHNFVTQYTCWSLAKPELSSKTNFVYSLTTF